MPPSSEQALLDLIEDIFSTSCIVVAAGESGPEEYRTTTLLLRSARTASFIQRVQLLLQLLLSHPPFTHTSPTLLASHQERFFTIWSRDHATTLGDKNGENLSPNRCLDLLAGIRIDFQRLHEMGFRFISELLLSCLEGLAPENSAGNGASRRGWVPAHDIAVNVLEELLLSVPSPQWLRLDTHSEYAAPLWRCLQLLCSGASWWGSSADGQVYQRNLQRLGRCVFSPPSAVGLLRAALRIDMQPTDIHSTVTALLAPLERDLGVYHDARLNAFTPTPFSFPTLSALDRHDFEKAYEYDSLRVMFVAWILANPMHRQRDEFRSPWRMETVLQHTEAWKKLKVHPESCVRVALIYIYNEVQQGCQGFKPSTDAKAIELLKTYIAYRHIQLTKKHAPAVSRLALKHEDVRDRPEACVVQNADWVMPWLWKRRGVDMEFAMIVTSAWLVARSPEDGRALTAENPICQLTRSHAEAVFEIFHGFFKTVFSYEFVAKSVNQESALEQIRKLLVTVLEVIMVIGKGSQELMSSQLCLLLIRTFMDSLDQEWIEHECWSKACEMFTCVPKLPLSEAARLAGVNKAVELLIPIFLREIEAITSLCSNSTPATLAITILSGELSNLTSIIQFTTFVAKSCVPFRLAMSKKNHFINSARLYAGKGWKDLLLRSEKPGIYWAHSASVGAMLELLVVLEFGNAQSLPDTGTKKRAIENSGTSQAVGDIVLKVLDRNWEMAFVISGLCGLVTLVSKDWWANHPFVFLDVWSHLRNMILGSNIHRFCALLPAFNQALSYLLSTGIPSSKMLINSGWNLALSSTLLSVLLEESTSPWIPCSTCTTPAGIPMCNLLTTLLLHDPIWKTSLLGTAGKGSYSILDFKILDKRVEKFVQQGNVDEAVALAKLGGCWESWSAKAKVWGKRCERERRAAAGVGDAGRREGSGGWYRGYRPIEGAPMVFVPT